MIAPQAAGPGLHSPSPVEPGRRADLRCAADHALIRAAAHMATCCSSCRRQTTEGAPSPALLSRWVACGLVVGVWTARDAVAAQQARAPAGEGISGPLVRPIQHHCTAGRRGRQAAAHWRWPGTPGAARCAGNDRPDHQPLMRIAQLTTLDCIATFDAALARSSCRASASAEERPDQGASARVDDGPDEKHTRHQRHNVSNKRRWRVAA